MIIIVARLRRLFQPGLLGQSEQKIRQVKTRVDHRLTAAESALRGVALHDEPALRWAIGASFADARPLARNAFKVELAQRAVVRAIQTAGARA